MSNEIAKLSERTGLGFMEGGRFRKGIKLKNKDGVEYPKEVDYFVFQEKEGLESKEYAKKINKLFGDEPKRLKIFFPPNDISELWSSGYEAYANDAVIAISDGYKFQFLVDNETNLILVYDGELQEKMPKSLSHLTVTESGEVLYNRKTNKGKGEIVGFTSGSKRKEIYMKPVGRLKFMIDGILEPVYFMLLTNINRDIDTIADQLNSIFTLAEMVGKSNIGGVKADLFRIKGQKTHRENGKKMTSDSWYVHLSVSREWFEVAMGQIQTKALEAPTQALEAPTQELLSAPEEEPEQNIIDSGYTQEAEFSDEAADIEDTTMEDDRKAYRAHVDLIGMDDKSALSVLQQSEMNYSIALKALQEQHTPPA